MHISGTTPLWIAARSLLFAQGDVFFRCWRRAAKTFEHEDIHDLRVASRRLREGFSLFADSYPRRRISFLSKKIKMVTRILGNLRNLDEAFLFFSELSQDLGEPAGQQLEVFLAPYPRQRKSELKHLKLFFNENNPVTLRETYLSTVTAPYLFNPPPAAPDPFQPLSGYARYSMDNRLGTMLEIVPQARLPHEFDAQHRLRIAIKRFRYRLEILAPLFGYDYNEIHPAIKEYQDVLGKMHDLDVFAEMIRSSVQDAGSQSILLEAIVSKRTGMFDKFERKLKTFPLESIGTRLRSNPDET